MDLITQTGQPIRSDHGIEDQRRTPDALFKLLAEKISAWSSRTRQREALAHLDERLLCDIGVERIAAAREASQPFWK